MTKAELILEQHNREYVRRQFFKLLFVWLAIFAGGVLFLYEIHSFLVRETVKAEVDRTGQFEVQATAFCDKYLADGTEQDEYCLAGKNEWLGLTAMVWTSDNGVPGEFLGYYEFHDVGYGRSIGYGESTLHKGKCLGDIEVGNTIDMWMPTEEMCEKWGRRKVIIQLFDAKG